MGASKPRRDNVDQRILDDVKNGTGRTGINSGYPNFSGGFYPTDSDNDGMPDSFESQHGLNSQNANDAVQYSSAGYTWLEEYINFLAGTPVSSPPDTASQSPISMPTLPSVTQSPATITHSPRSNIPSTSPSPRTSSNGNITVPGRIEAEHFNNTGNNVGYYDVTSRNEGGQYLSNTSVDIERTSDTNGGFHNIGWTRQGEWLTYTFSVDEAGTYVIRPRVSNMLNGASFELVIDGLSIGLMNMRATGGRQRFQSIQSSQFNLSEGSHQILVKIIT